MAGRKEEIENALIRVFSPTQLRVVDDSHQHAGHVGNPDGKGETHFSVYIRSPLFQNLSMIRQHRLIYAALDGINYHALSIDSGSLIHS